AAASRAVMSTRRPRTSGCITARAVNVCIAASHPVNEQPRAGMATPSAEQEPDRGRECGFGVFASCRRREHACGSGRRPACARIAARMRQVSQRAHSLDAPDFVDSRRRAPMRLREGFVTAVAVLTLGAATARAQETTAEETEACLSCHADPALALDFTKGGTRSLLVDPQALAHSVHGARLRCTDCHPGMQEVPHPERTFEDAAAFRAAFTETCKRCHFDKYTKLVDGVHYRQLPRGEAPSCLDCHGAHDVSAPGAPRTRVSETCATCHADVGETY